MRYTRFIAITLGLALLAGSAAGDEVHELVKKTGAKQRFKDYTPKFTVEKKTFSFEHYGDKQQEWDFWVIKDRDKYVAVIPLPGFHSGTIYLLAHDPAEASTTLEMPTERWHIDTATGTELRTDTYIPSSEGHKPETYQWTRAEGTLTLTRKHAGTAKFTKWAHASGNKHKPEKYDTTNTFVFKVDPVHGYMVDGTYDMKVSPNPGKVECASLATAGRYSLWPGEQTCYRSAITPKGKEGYEGYWLNIASIGAAGRSQTCRDGGFGAYLNDKTGWSSAITLEGGDASIVVCNAHADLDFVTNWPKDAPEVDGMSHHVVKHRLLYLPPETTRHVWEKMNVRFTDRSKVQIRIGRKETFEDQPLPYTTRVRGLTFTGRGPEISEKHAHSGKKSMRVEGRVWPNLPQLNLQPNTKYVLEARVYVDGWDQERLAAAEQKARKKHAQRIERAMEDLTKCQTKLARRNKQGRKDPKLEAKIEKLKKTVKNPPKFEGLEKPGAYIEGDYYEWSPHSGQMVVKQRTDVARPSDRWQHVKLEFTSPKWGPFINVGFVAKNCTAYFDDFRLEAVEENDE
ncbi:MAG: hypothetical protein ACLFV7_02155 [Phycisphaerae bacterium]